MRISVDEEDVGFMKFVELSRTNLINVYVAGQLLKWVHTVDDESGFALAAKTDNKGQVTHPAVYQKIKGEVTIELIPKKGL
jgi:hypothetical protein